MQGGKQNVLSNWWHAPDHYEPLKQSWRAKLPVLYLGLTGFLALKLGKLLEDGSAFSYIAEAASMFFNKNPP